jgi:hypothetical protein
MQQVWYAIAKVETSLGDNGTAGRLRNTVENEHWRPEANEATVYITFEESGICEVHLGIVSDLQLLVWGYNDEDCGDKMLIGEKAEKAASKGFRLCKCVNTDVRVRQYRDMKFTKAKLEFTSDRGIEIAFLSLFRKGETGQVPAIIPSGYNLKRKAEPASPIISNVKKPKKASPTRISPPRTVAIPKVPITSSISNTKPTRFTRKGPTVSTDPAETSYSGLLSDCVVTSLTGSEHIQRLCECLGACYLDHLEDITTHVVLPASLEYDEEVLRKTEAKLVSVEWLEKCLGEKRRQKEEEFQIL